MLETRKNTTLTGTSYIEKSVGGSEPKQRINVVYLSASIADDGSNINITKTIQSKEDYLANKEACDVDMAEFETMAFDLIK